MQKSSTKKYIRVNQDIDTSLLSLEMVWLGFMDKRVKDHIGVSAPDSFLEIVKGSTINYYADAEEMKLFVEKSAESICENKKLIKNLKEKTISLSNEMQKYARGILPKITSLTKDEIIDIFKRITFFQSESSMYGVAIALCDVDGDVTNKLLRIVSRRKNLKYPQHIYSSVLGSPFGKSLTEEVYEEIRRGEENDQELLNKYFWLDQGYIGRGLNKIELEKIRRSEPVKEGASASELERELDLTKEEKSIFEIYRDIIFSKSLRADTRQFLYVIMNKLVDVLATKWNVEPKYVESLYTNELIDILSGNKSFPLDIKERQEHSVLIPSGSKDYTIKLGQDAEEYVKKHFAKENLSDDKIIKGQVAYHGFVRGKVKLIFGSQHNDKISKGDVLVSASTSPQLLPAMKQAAAFLTDVGGITSHAAIVARELKKPCVVGTKYATQILKDGDMVEVDANKGIVRRIDG